MAYGIDELIEQKTDAYRGNPAALEQRSKMSNELVDLIALQKLKSEHDTAKRELQMQIQTQPDTIAKQLEAEMVGRTKDDVLRGVSGVLATNQARQQQRVASLGIAPQPRPNMQNMAQGGIVGFQEGKQVESPYTGSRSKQREDILRDLEAGTISQERADELIKALPLPTLGSALEQLGRAVTPQVVRDAYGNVEEFLYGTDEMQSPVQSVLRGADDLTRYVTGGVEDLISGDYMKPAVDYLFTPTPTAPEKPEEPVTTEEPVVEPPVEQEKEQTAPEPEKDPLAEGIAGLQQVQVAKRGELDAGTRALDAQRRALASNLAAVDPKAERAEAQQYAEEVLGRTEKADQYADMLSRLEALNKEQMDPDKLRNERLMATLLGAQGSTIADALGSSGRAGMEAGRQQEIAKRQRVMDELNLQSKAIEVDVDLGKSTLVAATEAVRQASADRRDGMTQLGNITDKENDRLDKEVKNKLDADIANARTNLGKLQLLSQAADRAETRRSTDLNQLTKLLVDINEGLLKTYNDLREGDMSFQALLVKHSQAKANAADDPEAYQESTRQINAAMDDLYLQAQKMATNAGLLTTRADIEKRVNELLGVERSKSGGINIGDVQGITQKST